MTSHARCTTFASATVGWLPAGIALRPSTTVLVPVAGSDRIDAMPGIGIPPSTFVPFEFRWPNSVSGTSLVVFGTSSICGELGRLVVVDPAGQRVADAPSGSAS